MRNRFLRWLLISIACQLLLVPSCTQAPVGVEERTDSHPIPVGALREEILGSSGGVLRYPLAGSPETFNHLAARDSRSRIISSLTTATLLEFDTIGQEVRGGLTESYEWSEDAKTLTIVLREGIRFSDGVALTADDVIFTFGKIYAEDSKSTLRDTLLVDGLQLSLVKKDDLKLQIVFPRYYAPAEYMLTTVPILPKHLLEATEGPIESVWTIDTPPGEMAGLGPYVVSAQEPGVRTLLEYNPHYWRVDSTGRRLPYLDKISLEYVEDRNSQILRLKAGELDLIDQVIRPEDIGILEGSPGVETLDAGPSGNLTFFWFNLGGSLESESAVREGRPGDRWFRQKGFRRAIESAINRKAIVRNVFLGKATEASSVVPSSNKRWFAMGLDRQSYDPERARTQLKDAGFGWRTEQGKEMLFDPDGQRVSFELLTRTDEVLGRIAALIQQDLAEIGIEVSIRQEEFRAVIGRIMGSRQYDSALMNLDFPIEPSDINNVLSSSGSMHMWNPGQQSPATAWEARIDELMRSLASEKDPSSRVQLFREVQEILAEEVPFVPLVNRNVLVAKRTQLKGIDVGLVFPYALGKLWGGYLER